MKQCLLVSIALAIAFPALAQNQEPKSYDAITLERGTKIVATLGLTNPETKRRVGELIAQQYQALDKLPKTPELPETRSQEERLHKAFVEALAALLTPEQVEKVKDGMTYGVVPLTYRVYLRMYPKLNEEQKHQILTWLKEARELAMDAGTAKAKHAVFGKFKGRINNYLVTQGYDLKEGERNLKGSL